MARLYCNECGFSGTEQDVLNDIDRCPDCESLLITLIDPVNILDFIFKREDIEVSGTYEVDTSEVISWWRDGIIDANSKVILNKGPSKGRECKIGVFPELVRLLNKVGLTECKQCSAKISIRAMACPKCGEILRGTCLVCHVSIPATTGEPCPQCGDPDPFQKSSKTEAILCPKCGAEQGTEWDLCSVCKEPLPEDIYESKFQLIECLSCHKKISERATLCPHCKADQTKQPCQICGKSIPFKNKSCPNCGDPDPFQGKHNKEPEGVVEDVTPPLSLDRIDEEVSSGNKGNVIQPDKKIATKGKTKSNLANPRLERTSRSKGMRLFLAFSVTTILYIVIYAALFIYYNEETDRIPLGFISMINLVVFFTVYNLTKDKGR